MPARPQHCPSPRIKRLLIFASAPLGTGLACWGNEVRPPQLTCLHLELHPGHEPFPLISPPMGLTFCLDQHPQAHANPELLQVAGQGTGEAPAYWCSWPDPGLYLVTPFLLSLAGQQPRMDVLRPFLPLSWPPHPLLCVILVSPLCHSPRVCLCLWE